MWPLLEDWRGATGALADSAGSLYWPRRWLYSKSVKISVEPTNFLIVMGAGVTNDCILCINLVVEHARVILGRSARGRPFRPCVRQA